MQKKGAEKRRRKKTQKKDAEKRRRKKTQKKDAKKGPEHTKFDILLYRI